MVSMYKKCLKLIEIRKQQQKVNNDQRKVDM